MSRLFFWKIINKIKILCTFASLHRKKNGNSLSTLAKVGVRFVYIRCCLLLYIELPLCSLSTCSTRATGSRKPLLHLGQTSIVMFITPFFSCTFCTWSMRALTVENLRWHCGHGSTWLLLLVTLWLVARLLCPICCGWLNSLLNFSFTDDTTFKRLVVHLEVVVGWAFFESSLLPFRKFMNWKVASGFLGPAQLWSGPNRCFKQWSIVQSRHLIVLEKVKSSLQRGTGHFFFFVAFS